MTEIKGTVTEATAEASIKKRKRGINNQTQAVNQLRFHEKDAANNGLFVGHLAEVRVDYSVNTDGKSFTGMNIPRLTFHFTSNHSNVNEQRHVYQTLFPVESNINTIPGGSEEWKVNNVLNWIKHILDVFYLKGRQLTEAEEDSLTIPFVDFDDNGEYIALDPEEILKGYATLFNNAASMLNGTYSNSDTEATGKPCYKDANGKYISLWIKLLRHRKRKNTWINIGQNGDLAFDNFIGNGVIEIQKPNTPPAILRLDLSKESITPKETKKQPAMGILGNPMGGVMTGAPSMMDGAQDMSAFNNADDEMPF